MEKTVSVKQLQRFPIYLKYLISMRDSEVKMITSSLIARALNYSEEQVKKDLQVVTTEKGVPNKGRNIQQLINDLESFLGYRNVSDAIVVGVGNLGSAFMNYKGFEEYGLNILMGFDIDEKLIGKQINNKTIFPMNKLKNLVQRMNIGIAILTTPASVSQEVVETLQDAGIKAIWNFVPVQLQVNENIVVENVNLASSLAILSHKLNKKYQEEKVYE